MTARTPARDRGFTLVEMMVTLLIVSVVMFAVFRVFTSTNETYERGTESIDGQQNTRAALSWLTRELRSARGFTFIASDEVTFLSDARVRNQSRTFRLDENDEDGDGDVSELLLIRNPADDGSPGPVVDEVAVGIDSLVFIYRDLSGAPTPSRVAVQEVEVAIFAMGSAGMRDGARHVGALTRQTEMRTRVRCRNLGKSVPTLGDVTPPASPTGLYVTVGCGTATLGWAANSEADLAGYYLSYERGSGGSPYNGVGAEQGPSPIFVGNVTTYTLTGLDISSTYYFNLQAVDGADNVSGYGGEVHAQPEDVGPPATPTNLTGMVVGEDRIRLLWDPSPDWDAFWYKIYWFESSQPSQVYVDSTTATTLTVESLTRNAVYVFAISAADDCGNESGLSSEITVTMIPCDEDVDFPDIPTNLTAVPGDEFVQLHWDRVPDSDVVGYQVYFVEAGYTSGSTILVGNVDQYSIYGLENGTGYQFQVAALDGCGHLGGYTGLIDATPAHCGGNTAPPTAPANLYAEDLGYGDRVAMSWTAGTEGDVLGYRVHWGTSPGYWDGSTDVGDEIFYTLGGLVAGTLYYLSVTAYDVCGNESAMATPITATPTWGCACPPWAGIDTPSSYAIVSGTVPWTVSAVACSTATLQRVEFIVDGEISYVDHTAPYAYGDLGAGWNTGLEENGPHQLIAVAVDDNGCEGADTIGVYVDNSGLGVSCIGVEKGDQGQVSGDYGEQLRVPVTNLSVVDTYAVDRIVLTWNSSDLTLVEVEFDGFPVYSAGGLPGKASGDTVDFSYACSVLPEDEVDMDLVFWQYPPQTPPEIDLTVQDFKVTFFGGPILECGDYDIPVSVGCTVNVEIKSVTSGNSYEVQEEPQVGDPYYTDRTYVLTALPAELDGSTLIRQPNDDKNKGDSHLLVLEVDHDVTVWIAYDPRGTPPNWIRDAYAETALTIGVTDSGTSTLGLWCADFPAGEIEFQGNKAAGWGGAVGTNYVIFVACR